MKLNKTKLKQLRNMVLNLEAKEEFDMACPCRCLGGWAEKKKVLRSGFGYPSELFKKEATHDEVARVTSFLFAGRWSMNHWMDDALIRPLSDQSQEKADCIGRIDALLAGYYHWEDKYETKQTNA